jgi:hypothetical protein
MVNMVLLAPLLLSFLITTIRSRPEWAVFTRMLETNFCKRILSRSEKPCLGENANGLSFLEYSMKRLISGPGLYIIPVAMSTFRYIWFSDGRMDWKYPLHSSMPPPILFLPSGVKKERVLNGYFWLGPIRITTFKALKVQLNEREKHLKLPTQLTMMAVSTALSWDCFPSMKRCNNLKKGQIIKLITGQDEEIVLGIDLRCKCHLHFVNLWWTTPRSGRRALARERNIKLDG